jgi:hypothetical protein
LIDSALTRRLILWNLMRNLLLRNFICRSILLAVIRSSTYVALVGHGFLRTLMYLTLIHRLILRNVTRSFIHLAATSGNVYWNLFRSPAFLCVIHWDAFVRWTVSRIFGPSRLAGV